MTVRYSIAVGRPIGGRRKQGHTVTWAAWWSEDPQSMSTPLPRPDATGGARTREDVAKTVQHVAGDRGPLELIPARFCQAWRRIQREERTAAENARSQARAERDRNLPLDELFRRRFRLDHKQWARAMEDARAAREACERAAYATPEAAEFAEHWRRVVEELNRQAAGRPHVEEFTFRMPPAAPVGPPAWCCLLGLSWPSFSAGDVTRSFRALAFDAHPDRGGSHDAFVALNAARIAALAHLEITR